MPAASARIGNEMGGGKHRRADPTDFSDGLLVLNSIQHTDSSWYLDTEMSENFMHPKQIEAFRVVVQLGSMTRAAEFLGISQPAVSRLIRDYEVTVGFPLFRREGNRLMPTYEATILVQEVELHYHGVDRINQVALELKHQSLGVLKIAAPSSLATFFLPSIIKEFSSTASGIGIIINSHSSLDSLGRVARRQFNMGLVQVSGEYPGVRIIPLSVPEAVCIMPEGHRLATSDTVNVEMLANETFISLGRNSPLRARIDSLFNEQGIERPAMIECDLAATVRAMVSKGLGVSIVDPFVASAKHGDGVCAVRFVPAIPFEVAVVVPSQVSLSMSAQRFLDLIRVRFRQVSQAKL